MDLYKADLSGQWLRLPGNVGSEVLCLDLEADPLGRLAETNETITRRRWRSGSMVGEFAKVNSAACR